MCFAVTMAPSSARVVAMISLLVFLDFPGSARSLNAQTLEQKLRMDNDMSQVSNVVL